MSYRVAISLLASGMIAGCGPGLKYQRTKADIVTYTIEPEHSRGNIEIDSIVPSIMSVRKLDKWSSVCDVRLHIHGSFNKQKGWFDPNQYIESFVAIVHRDSCIIDDSGTHDHVSVDLFPTDLYNNFGKKVSGQYSVDSTGKSFVISSIVALPYYGEGTTARFSCKGVSSRWIEVDPTRTAP